MRSKDENKIYEIKRCIESSVENRGFSPTMQEIADKVRVPYVNTYKR